MPTSIAFVGFDSSEMDLITLSVYQKGTNFQSLSHMDTLIGPRFSNTNDTFLNPDNSTYSFDQGFFNIVDYYDYKVELPSANKSYLISNFKIYDQDKGYYIANDGPCGKLQFVQYGYISYELDGNIVQMPHFPPSAHNKYVVYVVK
ncbi:MAG: hypothetical protein EOP54_01355 [Sphingobacteriales bacterium]|nr:MAG: hypothetical protein EOP54_01355 [Sphingobacteriales bacterium]